MNYDSPFIKEFKDLFPSDKTLILAVLKSDWEGMRRAISAGEVIDQIHDGMTPLLCAVYRGDGEAVRILLDSGADPNFNPTPRDPSHTPLWHAEDDFGLTEIAQTLKSFGAKKQNP
jgi:hypothetical protein